MRRYLGPPPADGKVHRWLQDLYRVLSSEDTSPAKRQPVKPAYKVPGEKAGSSENGVILFDVNTKNLDWSADNTWLQINPQDKLDLTGGTLTGDLVLPNLTATGNIDAVNATLSGDLSAINATLTGDLAADNATLLGDVSAVNATLSGDISAVAANFSSTLNAGTTTISGGITISGTGPYLYFNETDAPSTHSREFLVMSGGNFLMQTRNNSGVFVAQDYGMVRGASGATSHSWQIAGSTQFRIEDGVIRPGTTNDVDLGSVTYEFKDAYFAGALNLGGTANVGGLFLEGAAATYTLSETDVATTHRQEVVGLSGGDFYMQTRNSAGSFVAHDYIMSRGAAGATAHAWSIEGSAQFRIEDGVIRPGTTNDVDLGSVTYKFKDLYLSGSAEVGPLITDSIKVRSSNPFIYMTDTDVASYQFTFQNSGGNLSFQTRDGAGVFVSHDYYIAGAASGAVQHQWRIENSIQLLLTDGVFRPGTTNDVDLGSVTYKFKDAHFAGNLHATTAFVDKIDTDDAGDQVVFEAGALRSPNLEFADLGLASSKGIHLSFQNGPVYVQRDSTVGDGGYLYVGYRGTEMNFLVEANGDVVSEGEVDAAGGFAVNGNPTGLGVTTPPEITDFTAELHPGFYRFNGTAATGGPFTTAFNGSCIVARGGSEYTSLIAWRQSGSYDTVGQAWLGNRNGATGAISWSEIALASSFEDVGDYIDEFTLADDAASGRPAPAHGCFALVQTNSPTIGQGYPHDRSWAFIRFHTTPSPAIDVIGSGTLVETTTGVLTGTTGTDIRLTLSPHSDLDLYVENRLGGAADVRIQWFRGLI